MEALILGGLRSFIGIEGGIYRNVPAEKLGAFVLEKVLEKYGISAPDMVIAGNAVGGGGNIARLAALTAGLDCSVPAFTVDMQCASALESIVIAAEKIMCGEADVIVAGGFESSSTSPLRTLNENHPEYDSRNPEKNIYRTARFSPETNSQTAMLEGAERTALINGISRKMLNRHVLSSHEKALSARESGVLSDICIPYPNCPSLDQGVRSGLTIPFLDRIPCVLKNGSVSTAANCCLTNDGAAFIILCSRKFAEEKNLSPKAVFAGSALAACNPSTSPECCTLAVEKLLSRCGIHADDIDVFEYNEAFAVIDELFLRKFPSSAGKCNIFGGALAYGHPYGASGAVILLHALKALEVTGGKNAVCAVAAAGGTGNAVILKKIN